MIDIKQAQRKHVGEIVNFQQLMALETENLELSSEILHSGVQKFFDEPQLGKYFIAELDNKLVGCCLIQFEWSDWRNAFVVWLHSVYIKEEHRSKGIFAKMYNFIKEMVANSDNYSGIRLFVDKTNTNAQKVYERLGMTAEHYELFEWLK